jgi:hypothetical protein
MDVKLTAEDLRRIDEVFPTGAAAGLRYPRTHDENRERIIPARKAQGGPQAAPN